LPAGAFPCSNEDMIQGPHPSLAHPLPEKGPPSHLRPEQLKDLHQALLLPRMIEEKMLLLLRGGKLSKWFSGMGQEAIAVGVTAALAPDDWILPLHRNLGVFTARGVDLGRLFRQLLGKEGGFTKGRDRTFHFGALDRRIVGMISHLGSMLPVADGLALASQLRGEKRVAAAFIGDGATSEGDFHEALNLAAVWSLPVLFIIENNQFGLSTPIAEQYACRDLADRAVGYGMPGIVVDGNDVLAVYGEVLRAADRARQGEGPSLLEFKTFRMRGHEEASGTDYVPEGLVQEWRGRDPLARLEDLLVEKALLTEDDKQRIRAENRSRIDAAVEAALASAPPSSTPQREIADVYAPSLGSVAESPDEAPDVWIEIRYVDAIAEGLRLVMRRHSQVVLMGQDIAEYGGVFKVTQGLVQEFGKARVRNTPLMESGAIGAAMGLALDGFVPMVEMQFGDFISCGFNQIVNNLAKTYYRWGARLPLVLRVPVGGGVGAGPFHSQNVEAWFTHVAGLKVLAPSTPYDAKGLLISAFEDGNPVLFMEHKLLYRSLRGRVPPSYYSVPIGQARVARVGRHATIVTYGVGVLWALEAATQMALDGKEVEVVDLRSLVPWDQEMVLASVRKTGRVLVLHEAPLTGGFGGEIAAAIGHDAFEWLDAPVARLGAFDTPVPFSRTLEEILSPKTRLPAALLELLSY